MSIKCRSIMQLFKLAYDFKKPYYEVTVQQITNYETVWPQHPLLSKTQLLQMGSLIIGVS